jgi:hypothetical protein
MVKFICNDLFCCCANVAVKQWARLLRTREFRPSERSIIEVLLLRCKTWNNSGKTTVHSNRYFADVVFYSYAFTLFYCVDLSDWLQCIEMFFVSIILTRFSYYKFVENYCSVLSNYIVKCDLLAVLKPSVCCANERCCLSTCVGCKPAHREEDVG